MQTKYDVNQQHTNSRPTLSTPFEAAMSVEYTQGLL
jgi:hypothetical protein